MVQQTGTMTFLFSDIVGSTDLLTRLGERDWDDVLRKHFSVLREALAEHAGSEVKNTGDGLMAVFGSAINAVDCALAMQQQALRVVVVGGTPVGIRIGIATGEATHDQGDWFGTPVVEAARLCAPAGTNESWATGLVRMLAGSQVDARFVSIEAQSLKGFDQPVEVFKVEPPEGARTSMFAQVDQHDQLGEELAELDLEVGLQQTGGPSRSTGRRRRSVRHPRRVHAQRAVRPTLASTACRLPRTARYAPPASMTPRQKNVM
jgi:class 3 adenylate cyclase